MKENLITNGIDNKKNEIYQENNLFKEIFIKIMYFKNNIIYKK